MIAQSNQNEPRHDDWKLFLDIAVMLSKLNQVTDDPTSNERVLDPSGINEKEIK